MDASTGSRCDRCGARAKWLYLDADNEWQWCGHHDRELRSALMAAGFDRYELAVPDVRNVGTRAIHGG
ncbi:MAG: DUF7455 domain-containing protein [Mycobacteriaceae bacterium]